MSTHIALTLVREHLQKGDLTMDMLGKIEQGLTVDNHNTEAFCHSMHENCIKNERLDRMVSPRVNVFGRIMVQPLEVLFHQEDARFSKDQLGNYFHMLEAVLGRDQYERYHDQLSKHMREQVIEKGRDFEWGDFYKSSFIEEVRLQTLASIAVSFQHFDQRVEWFKDLMETNEDGTFGNIQFTNKQVKNFIETLFAEISSKTRAQGDRIKEVLTPDQLTSIWTLLKNARQL